MANFIRNTQVKAMTSIWTAKQKARELADRTAAALTDRTGQGTLDVAITVLISIVLGALILAGLYLIVDDTAYILGGRNTFGYFLGSYEGHKNHDRDVLVYNTGSRDSSLYQLRAYYEQITAQDCCSLFHDSPSLSEKKSVQAAAQTLRDRFQTLTEAYPEQHSAPYDYPANTAATQLVTLISNPIDTGPKEPVAFYQLMELCKSEPLCIFYHHHRSIWHIYTYFHYCSRHQHLDFSPCKLFHDPVLFLGLHFSMEHSNGDV